ncbi:cupin domain-containing protein [Terriglobus sp. RCC_193]|uniref:cupin domain-containing protein n=1 Tax=Terriglobus sp. RCC_193 TaxID=3239218 RepID=UPI0035235752
MSTVKKQFYVFGELVEVIVSSKETNGTFCVIRQYSDPGGGPPPHIHSREDEFFTVIDGEFEILNRGIWHPIGKGETAYTLRNNPHTFRNRGASVGCIQATVIPGGLDEYLEELSRLSMPPVIEEVLRTSEPYGVSFIAPTQ